MGDAAVALARREEVAERAVHVAEERGERKPRARRDNHGIGHGGPVRRARSTRADRAALDGEAGERVQPHLAAAGLDEGSAPARRRDRSSDTRGRPSAASRGRPPNIRASTRTNGAARACRIGWLSAASASGSHSISISRGVWRWRSASRYTVSSSSRRIGAGRQRGPHASERQAIAPAHAGPAAARRPRDATAPEGSGSAERTRRLRASMNPDLEPRLQRHEVAGADLGRGSETSRRSSRRARAGRCPPTRRSRDPDTRSPVRRGARGPRARATGAPARASATAADEAGEARRR